ncbi:MAG TPA: FHA domain-containing protein [Polyangia bacterium]
MALPGRKSLRQFQCNDTLWVTFRRMAEDQEKEVDDVIADALEAYAQLSGYQTGINALESESQLTPPPAARQHQRAAAAQVQAPTPPPPPPPPAPARSRFAPRVPQPSGVSMFDVPSTPLPHPHAAAFASGIDGTPAAQPSVPVYLVFDNQKYRIDKDQFIIGRGTKSSDLPIKDGNISRKHAAVIRRNGTYFIKDLGSTNGIDFKGMRIDNKRIEEGDIFHLCDYELRFTFKR